jgi:uncharacterized protein YidB (DUF937 family)
MAVVGRPRPTAREALKVQLAAIRGHEPESSRFEVRPLTPEGRPATQDRAFIPVRELDEVTRLVERLAPRLNVFVGVAPRTRQSGRADAVARLWTLWVDIDDRQGLENLRDFRPLPTIVIRSGSADCAHAYWALHKPVSPHAAQRSARRLALALGGDPAATDPARVLRPAGSRNHKCDPPAEVVCSHMALTMFTFGEVVGDLPDSAHYAPRPMQRPQAQRYPNGALGGVLRRVREASVGERNQLLNWAAFTLAQRVTSGELDSGLVQDELRQAALAAGLGETEVERTIRSGLDAGARSAA